MKTHITNNNFYKPPLIKNAINNFIIIDFNKFNTHSLYLNPNYLIYKEILENYNGLTSNKDKFNINYIYFTFI